MRDAVSAVSKEVDIIPKDEDDTQDYPLVPHA